MDKNQKRAWKSLIEKIGYYVVSPQNQKTEEELIKELSEEGFVVDFFDSNDDGNFYVSVIKYLNEKAGTRFQILHKSTAKSLIIARRKEGYSLEHIYAIIDMLVHRWKGTQFEMHLTPSTIFHPNKFDNYAGQVKKNSAGPGAADKPKTGVGGFAHTVDEAVRAVLNAGNPSGPTDDHTRDVSGMENGGRSDGQ